PEMYASPEVQQWRRALSDRQATFDRVKATAGEQHEAYQNAEKDVVNARAELSRARALVIERLKNEMDLANSTRSVRQNYLNEIDRYRTQVNSKGIDYASLQRMQEAQAGLLESLTTQLAEQGAQASAIRNN